VPSSSLAALRLGAVIGAVRSARLCTRFPSTAVRRLAAAASLIFPGAGVPGPGWVIAGGTPWPSTVLTTGDPRYPMTGVRFSGSQCSSICRPGPGYRPLAARARGLAGLLPCRRRRAATRQTASTRIEIAAHQIAVHQNARVTVTDLAIIAGLVFAWGYDVRRRESSRRPLPRKDEICRPPAAKPVGHQA
jgi:hypothetical protein